MAQDRLFQLDYLRRKGVGARWPKSSGRERLELDLLARTVGLRPHRRGRMGDAARPRRGRCSRRSPRASTPSSRRAASACRSSSICSTTRPTPWTPVDSLAIAGEFRWYLTGRFPGDRHPGTGQARPGRRAALRAFLQGEADDESILPPGEYPAAATRDGSGGSHGRLARRRSATRDGSNNWVVAGRRTRDRQAAGGQRSAHRLRRGVVLVRGPSLRRLVQRRRHRPTPACPAIMFGRNERVGLGHDQQHLLAARSVPGADRPRAPGLLPVRRPVGARPRAGRGDPRARRATGAKDDPLLAQRSDRRRMLPRPRAGPGRYRSGGSARPCGWLTSLLALDRAKSVEELREAPRRLARADVEPGVRRRRGPHRLSGRRPDPDPRRAGSAAIGPAGIRSTSGTA